MRLREEKMGLLGLDSYSKEILYGTKPTKRKAFTISTKKIEWMKAGGHKPELYTEKGIFYKTSKCRNCPRKLTWGDRTYDFDHKDNNPLNNSQKNCYLVCKVCHGKHTVIKKRKVRDPYLGHVVGHSTIKKKVGYKKPKKKKTTKKKTTRKKKQKDIWDMEIDDLI
jgi:hypothetical protein